MNKRIIWCLTALLLLVFTLSACQKKNTELSDLIALAESGDVEAQVQLADAYLYATPPVGETDYAEAIKWYTDAANQNNAWAENQLGFMYFRGLGVDKNVDEAVHWVKLGADHGNAMAQGDFSAYLELVNRSGLSSQLLLQNSWSSSAPHAQAVTLALTVGQELLGGQGAIRVHGGGFAGTIQAFVPHARVSAFQAGMESVLGEGCCHFLRICPQGGSALK